MEKNQHDDQHEEVQKIPVFTVLKNNTILKNIFLLQNPIPVTNHEHEVELENPKNGRNEEILTVGRHPDCTIMLTHPSISRFHLRVYLHSSLQKMWVFDLASVHGTWVSDRRIEPGVRVELNEGDTIQMGCSSRVYRLHWVSLSIAFDLENPVEDDSSLLYGDKKVESLDSVSEVVESYLNEENFEYLDVNEVQSASLMPVDDLKADAEKVLDDSSEEDNEKSDNTIHCLDPTTAFTLNDDSEGMSDEEKISNYDSLEEDQGQLENIIPGSEPTEGYLFNANCEEFDHEFQPDVELNAAQHLLADEPGKKLHLKSMFDEGKISTYDSLEEEQEQLANLIHGSEPTDGYLFNANCEEIDHEDLYDAGNISNYESIEEHQKQLENIISNVELLGANLFDAENEKVDEFQFNVEPSDARHLLDQDEAEQRSLSCFDESVPGNNDVASLNVTADVEPNAVQLLLKDEVYMPHNVDSSCFDESIQVNNQSSSFNAVAEKECTQSEGESKTTPVFSYSENELSGQRLSMGNIWLRRGRPVSVLQIETGSLKGSCTEVGTTNHEVFMKFGDEDENYTPNKENVTPNPNLALSKQGKGMEKQNKHLTPFNPSSNPTISSPMFSPDKENRTPKPQLALSNQGKGTEKQKQQLTPFKSSSSKLAISSPMFSSDKENQTPSNGRRISARKSSFGNRVSRVKRVPFQSLLLNSGNSSSAAVSRVRSLDNITNVHPNNTAGEVKKKMWYMVVDSSSLLDKKSMRALRLLQGLKGTQLIVPKTVMKELDNLKLRVSMFRRQTEVFTALKWIEECMVSCKQWIRIQNSFDEGMRVALTPSASPQTTNSLMGAVSPKPEDHIFEDELLYKRLKNDGQLVLLSNDVNLKIKAMAEGVICETADDFRESLVNPFSERFMWAESSPRGQTWSCSDDVVLRDIYYACSIKKSTLKGLKLILFHNARCGQIKTVS